MTKIRWTDQEASIVAARFLQLRLESVENMGAFSGALLTRAMEALPEDRRRGGIPGFAAGRTFEDALSKHLLDIQALVTAPRVDADASRDELAQLRSFRDSVCTTLGVSLDTDGPALLVELRSRLAAAPTEELPPLVIEIATKDSGEPVTVNPQDLHGTLSNAPTGMLLGYALERLVSGLRGSLPPVTERPPASPRVETTPTTVARPLVPPAPAAPPPAPAAPPPAPASPTAAPVTAAVDSVPPPPRRVCVAGLFSGSLATLAPQVKQFANLDVNLLGPLDKTSRVVCDYAIIMRGSLPHGDAEALRKKLTAKDRVRYADTNDGVLRHLSDINSLQ